MKCLNLNSELVKSFLEVCPRTAVLASILDKYGDTIPTIEEVKAAYDAYNLEVTQDLEFFREAITDEKSIDNDSIVFHQRDDAQIKKSLKTFLKDLPKIEINRFSKIVDNLIDISDYLMTSELEIINSNKFRSKEIAGFSSSNSDSIYLNGRGANDFAKFATRKELFEGSSSVFGITIHEYMHRNINRLMFLGKFLSESRADYNNKTEKKIANFYIEASNLLDDIKKKVPKDKLDLYGLTNVDELFSEAFTNKKFQEVLKSIEVLDSKQDERPVTAFDKIINLILEVFNLTQSDKNALVEVLKLGAEIHEYGADVANAFKERNLKWQLTSEEEENYARSLPRDSNLVTSLSLGTVIDSKTRQDILGLRSFYNKTYSLTEGAHLAETLREKFPEINVRFSTIENTTSNVAIGRLTFEDKHSTNKGLSQLMRTLMAKFPELLKPKVISVTEAISLLGQKGYKANAFIIGKQIYLVEGKITDEVMMEEFFHPFIEAIFQQNKPLFNSLLKEISELYPELAENIKRVYQNSEKNDILKEIVTQGLVKVFRKEYNSSGEISLAKAISKMKFIAKEFFKWLDIVFGTNFVDAALIPQSTSIGTLATLLNTKGLTFESIGVENAMLSADAQTVFSRLEDIGRNVTMSADEKYYTVLGKAYARLTEWSKNFFNRGSGYTLANSLEYASAEAKKLFTISEPVLKDGAMKIEYNDAFYTEEELTNIKVKEYNNSTALGKVLHGIIDSFILKSIGKEHAAVDAQVELDATAKENQDAIKVDSFSWVTNSVKRAFKELGISVMDSKIKPEYRDKILTETYLYSDILKIATRADGVVVGANGAISMIDYKTGSKFLKSKNFGVLVGKLAEYASLIKLNRVTNAQIELMLRAMMIKEHMPEATFKQIVIAHLSRYENTYFKINTRDYINLFNDFFLKEAPEIHAQLKAKGLLDASTYETGETLTTDREIDLNSKAISELEQELVGLRAQLERTRDTVERGIIKNEMDKASTALMNLTFGVSVDNMRENTDVGLGQKLFGNFATVNNKVIQLFNRIFVRAKKDYDVRRKELFDEFDVIQKELIKEWRKTRTGVDLLYTPYFNKENTGLYNFLWVKKTRGDEMVGYYKIVPTDEEYKNLSPIQKKYVKFLDDNMKAAYKQNISKVLDDKKNTYAEFLGMPKELDSRFMPRVRMTSGEVTEHFGMFNSMKIKEMFNSMNQVFRKYEYFNSSEDVGMSFKYMEHPEVVANEYHSFNAEVAFKKFMDHMIFRDEMDTVYAIGKGISINLKSNKIGTSLSEASDFLEKRLISDILKMNLEHKWTSKPVRILGFYVSIDKIMDLLRQFVSKSTMILKPVAGLRNALLITLLNWKRAGVGSIAKMAGVPPDQIDFTVSDMAKSYSIALEQRFEKMFTKEGFGGTKLGMILKELNYRPENYDYLTSQESILSSKTRELTGGIEMSNGLYFFHKIGEDLGTDTILIAQLLRMKNHKTGLSMWDSYKVNPQGQLEWDGGIRGQDTVGNTITRITAEEEIKLKRASQLIHGSYRAEEKMAAEMYAIGRWGLMFKKYLPQAMMNLIQGRYDDSTIGRYEVKEMNGKDIMTWKDEINEGRVWLLLKSASNIVGMDSGNPAYKFENLRGRQKIEFIDIMTTASIYASLFLSLLAYWDDDDDEKDWWYVNSFRMANDISQGLIPADFVGAIQNNNIVISRTTQILGTYWDFAAHGLLMGERTQEGKVVGWDRFKKVTPGFSALYEIERITKGGPDKFEFKLNYER